MYKNPKSKPIIVTFRTSNGNQWDEIHSTRMFSIFKKDPTVQLIRDKETDNIVYEKAGK